MKKIQVGDEVYVRKSDFPSAQHVGKVGIVREIISAGDDDPNPVYGLEVPGSRRPLDEANETPWYYYLHEIEQL